MEFKKPGVPARAAFDENITSYKHPQNGIPALFWFNALIIASNGTDSRVGSITADWERMSEWKRVEREDEPRRVSLEDDDSRHLRADAAARFVENFTLFSEHKSGLIKILATESSGARREQRDRFDAASAQGNGHGRARRFLADARLGQKLLDGFLLAKGAAQDCRATGLSSS